MSSINRDDWQQPQTIHFLVRGVGAMRLCVFVLGEMWGTPHRHEHKESYKDLNLKILTSEWDSIPRPHEYEWMNDLFSELYTKMYM